MDIQFYIIPRVSLPTMVLESLARMPQPASLSNEEYVAGIQKRGAQEIA